MPWIIDYEMVLDQMRGQRMKSLYYNSGAFGFVDSATAVNRGWLGPADHTLKPAAVEIAMQVIEPYSSNLATLCTDCWQRIIGGKVWVMPMSHWAYELDYGSREWMPAVLEHLGLDPGLLESRTDAAAIEFAPQEANSFRHLLHRLLDMLFGSDFALAFPNSPVVCTVHHHQQLWWTTSSASLLERLDALSLQSGRLA